MGTVFRARRVGEPHSGPLVAVKRVPVTGPPDLMVRLSREAKALAGLDHPNVVRILEVVPDGAGVAIVMEYLAGGSVADTLTRVGRLSPTEVARLAAEVADALGATHALGLVHCDVKPSNVLLGLAGQAKLGDFGLARWMASASMWGGAVLGTAEYLDPAVAEGGRPLARSDVYSLGVMCYEALTGRLPYLGATPLAVLRAADRGKPVPMTDLVPDLPLDLVSVVEAAMARRPERRPVAAAEMAAALRGTLGPPPATVGLDRAGGLGTAETAEGVSGSRLAEAGPHPRPLPPRRLEARHTVPEAPSNPGGRRHRAALLAVPALLVGLMVLLALTGPLSGASRRSSSGPRPAGDDPTSCPSAPVAAAQVGAKILSADVAGASCSATAAWSGNVLSLTQGRGSQPERFSLGQMGDQALLGRWGCQPRATPALYRPSTGEVFYFSGWARPGTPLASDRATRTGVLDGQAHTAMDASGCDQVVVDSGSP